MITKALAQGKLLDGLRYTLLEGGDRAVRVDLGLGYGYRCFKTVADANAEVMAWLNGREKRAQKTLKDIAKVRRAIGRTA